MHRNYRRKAGKHNPKKNGHGRGFMRPVSLVEYRRAYWQKQRAIAHRLMAHERYDDLRVRHPHSIMWDIY